MAICESCNTKRELTFDSSTSSFYMSCACDLPGTQSISSTSSSYLTVKPSKENYNISAAQRARNKTRLVASSDATKKSFGTVYYQCLICEQVLTSAKIQLHALSCFYSSQLNRYKCEYCGKMLLDDNIQWHLERCTKSPANRPHPPILICEICNLPVSKDRLSAHNRSCIALAPRFNSGEMYRCLECAGSIISVDKDIHASRCPKNYQPILPKIHLSITVIKKRWEIICKSCPFCRTPLQEAEISNHSKLCKYRFKLINNYRPAKSTTNHKSKVLTPRKKARSSKQAKKNSGQARKGSLQDLGGAEDLMDATRGMGHVAREHGRIGSASIHDDYDN